MRIVFDKIASATRNAQISHEATLTSDIRAEEGVVVAVRVHGTKTVYNTVEDPYGRMIRLDDGDVLAGVLGSRRALRGYAGIVPASVQVGDMLDILNLGGVIGVCTSTNLELGPPLQAEILGGVLAFPFLEDRRGVLASIRDNSVPWSDHLEPSAPVVFVSGTCMNSGKTFACGEIIRYLTRHGRRVGAAKLTGVSLLRDTLAMQDRGAFKSLCFTDAGVVSTNEAVAVPVTRGLLNALNRERPDVLVVELGDGILGRYGVQEILHDDGVMAAGAMHLMCATDPVAAWGGVTLFRNEFKRRLDLITGPATDNAVGKEYIEHELDVAALNARLECDALGAFVERTVFGSST